MPGEIVTLKPNGGAELIISASPYELGMDTSWGEHTVDPGLATGPDIIGGVNGARTRNTTTAEVGVWVQTDDVDTYVPAVAALETAAAQFALEGGTVTRQVDFGNDQLSMVLEAEVVGCDIAHPEGWQQAHRSHGLSTLTLTLVPGWLEADEVSLAAVTTNSSTAGVTTITLQDRGGNLPSPARVVIDGTEAGEHIRFVEMGAAFDQEPQQVWYLADDFGRTVSSSVTGDAGTDVITATTHELAVGDRVRFVSITGGTGLTANTTYYVESVPTASTLKVSATDGGSAVDFSSNITAGTLVAAGGSANLATDSDAFASEALTVTPVLSEWVTVDTIPGIPHAGGYNVRIRVKGGTDDAQFIWRVLWRGGSGPWKELRGDNRVQTPDADNYYDMPAGVIDHYDDTETIDVRVDLRATATAASDTAYLNMLTLTPNELYLTASATPIAVPSVAAEAFDDFTSMDPGDSLDDTGGGANRIAILGGTFTEAGGGTATEWSSPWGTYIDRSAANDGAFNGANGYFALLGTIDHQSITNNIVGRVEHSGTADSESMLGNVVRYVDANNWLMAALRIRRQADGKYVDYLSLYKRDGGGTPSKLGQWSIVTDGASGDAGGNLRAKALHADIGVTVDTSGNYTVSWFGTPRIRGTDADLAQPSGSHDEGQIGAYSFIQGTRASTSTRLESISAYGSAPTFQSTDIVREDGIGEFNHETAFTSDADGGDPQPFTPIGNRIWIPPGTGGAFAIKPRVDDSATEPDDTGSLVGNLAFSITHRPAWVDLADVVVAPPVPYEELILSDGPELYWRLGASGATDLSGNGHDGAATGATLGDTPGALTDDADEATHFTAAGGADFISATGYNGGADNGQTRSWEVWVYKDNFDDYHGFIAWAGAGESWLRLSHSTGGGSGISRITFTVEGNQVHWDNAMPGNEQWFHLVLIFNESTNSAELYINGVSKGSVTQSSAWGAVTIHRIGTDGGWAGHLTGALDEYAVYERALTAGEILAHYETGANGP